LKYLGYADDLVFSCLHTDVPILIKVLKELGPKYNLKLNPRKSNWMRIRGHNGRELSTRETENIEETEIYRYLGILITGDGDLEEARKKCV
jgi:hypothetical protein